jgi:hypothetical protein
MKFKNVFVVCNKNTTIVDGVVTTLNYDVCDFGYTKMEDAIAKVTELTDNKMNEYLDEVDEGNCYRDSSSSNDWQKVTVNNDTYEYWVKTVSIPLDFFEV